MAKSRYDELLEKYTQILTTKAGTRYEILAAYVFKALDEQNVVIHDLKLVGDSDVKHQIDVYITRDGHPWRVLIECKDFDVSGDKIGLDIIRNVWAVQTDTGADEAIAITCNGFTRDAMKFAKAKGIKLAVMRDVRPEDMKGRIRAIALRLIIQTPSNPRTTVALADESEKARFGELAGSLMRPGGVQQDDGLFFVKGGIRKQFNEFMTERMNDAIVASTAPGTITQRVTPDGWVLEFEGHPSFSFDSVEVKFDVEQEILKREIESDRVAELVVSGLANTDIIIFGDQLERRAIDPDTGEIR